MSEMGTPMAPRSRGQAAHDEASDILEHEARTRSRKLELLNTTGFEAFSSVTTFRDLISRLTADTDQKVKQMEQFNTFLSWLAQEFNIDTPMEKTDIVLRDGI